MKKENSFLYTISGIACIFVVLIHAKMPGELGNQVVILARFGVPFFFMLSGYFADPSRNGFSLDKLKRKVLHSGKLLLSTASIYIVFHFIINGILIDDAAGYIKGLLLPSNWVKLILFNKAEFISGPLWFLLALIYTYIVYFLLRKLNGNWIYVLAPIILLSGYFGKLLSVTILDIEFLQRPYIFRNWLFFGVPMFLLGDWLRLNESRLKSISNKLLVTMLLVGIILSSVEMRYLEWLTDERFELGIGTLLVTVALFTVAINNCQIKMQPFYWMGKSGMSLYVYIFHMVIMETVMFACKMEFPGEGGYGMFLSGVVVVASLVVAYAITKIQIICKKC